MKILDFGLAKTVEAAGSRMPMRRPRRRFPCTRRKPACVLGTAAATWPPEQARGRAVDARVDIWAFGCVLYEAVTGVRAFKGDDVTDTIVGVITREPDWQAIPAPASCPPIRSSHGA